MAGESKYISFFDLFHNHKYIFCCPIFDWQFNNTDLHILRYFELAVRLWVQNKLLNFIVNNMKQTSLLDDSYIKFIWQRFLCYLCLHQIMFVMSVSCLMILIISR